MAKPLAIKYYRESPMFSEKYAQVTEPQSLPNGCGWHYWRMSIEKLIDMVAQCTPNLIICGHVKDTKLDENTSGSVKDLDLAGKKFAVLKSDLKDHDRAISVKAKSWIKDNINIKFKTTHVNTEIINDLKNH